MSLDANQAVALGEEIRRQLLRYPNRQWRLFISPVAPWQWTDGSLVVADLTNDELEVALQIRHVGGRYLWEASEKGSDGVQIHASQDVRTLFQDLPRIPGFLEQIESEAV